MYTSPTDSWSGTAVQVILHSNMAAAESIHSEQSQTTKDREGEDYWLLLVLVFEVKFQSVSE